MTQQDDHGGTTLYAVVRQDNESRKKEDHWQPLQIDGKDIKMLQEPILMAFHGSMRVTGPAAGATGSRKFWKLVFFAGTPYEERLFVAFGEDSKKSEQVLGQGVWQTLTGKGREPTSEQVALASQWLRDSGTLSLDHYRNRAGRFSCADGNGVSLFSSEREPLAFERTMLLVALAVAYRTQLEKLMNELASCDRNPKTLSALAQKASEFNARCYFRHPVTLSRVEAPLMWRDISERMQLDNLDQEMMEQVRTLHDITSSRAQVRENRRWQWVGLGLAVISAVQVISVFPEAVRDRWMYALLSFLGL